MVGHSTVQEHGTGGGEDKRDAWRDESIKEYGGLGGLPWSALGRHTY